MTSSGLTRTLVALAAATAVTATLAVVAAPTQALQADGPDYGSPTVGACSTMTLKQAGAQADKTTVVPCSQAHTAKVAGVMRLPGKLDYSSDAKQLYKAMLNRCKPEWNAMLGRTDAVRDSSAYDLVWFVPTKDQRQHGARWMSCSVVMSQGGAKLVKLRANKTPLLPSGKLKDGIHRCLLATTSSSITTPCSAKHGWRATGSFVIASKKFPGVKSVNRTARTKCASRTTRGKAYRWTYWTKLDWQVGGDHAVICYSKTTS
jgi:hypothetical protein